MSAFSFGVFVGPTIGGLIFDMLYNSEKAL